MNFKRWLIVTAIVIFASLISVQVYKNHEALIKQEKVEKEKERAQRVKKNLPQLSELVKYVESILKGKVYIKGSDEVKSKFKGKYGYIYGNVLSQFNFDKKSYPNSTVEAKVTVKDVHLNGNKGSVDVYYYTKTFGDGVENNYYDCIETWLIQKINGKWNIIGIKFLPENVI